MSGQEAAAAPLTRRERAVLMAIVSSVERLGYPPSIKEVAAAVGVSSTSSVHWALQSLQDKGHIRRVPGVPRAIQVLVQP